MKIAMVSYNTFVRGVENGWKSSDKGDLLLLQNTDGKTWGTTQVSLAQNPIRQWHDETKAAVDPLWGWLQESLLTIERVVFYVGSTGAEYIIGLAGKNGLAPERAVFVFCDCNMRNKQTMIHRYGFESSKIIMCGCGGQDAMCTIYDEFLKEGKLP